MSKFTLGESVHAIDTLYRDRRSASGNTMRVEKTWIRYGERFAAIGFSVNMPGARPVEGVVVGLRTLDESGTVTHYYGDEPPHWKFKTKRAAVLIAYDLRKKPALAWLEDVAPADVEIGPQP